MNDINTKSDQHKKSIFESKNFMYIFMASLIFYTLLCGYILIFTGSVFFEGIVKGWYKSSAGYSDNYALWWSVLTLFPCLLGVLGGVAVLSTSWRWFYKSKVLLFIPSVVWSTQLVLYNFRWGFAYWTQWLFLVPIMILSIFVLYCVVKKVNSPVLFIKTKKNAPEESSQVEVT